MTREHAGADKLLADLQAVVDDAEELLHATAGQAGEKVAAARARAEDSVRAAKVRIDEMQDELLERGRALARDADEYVRENPWQSVSIAAIAGLVIGLLVSRR